VTILFKFVTYGIVSNSPLASAGTSVNLPYIKATSATANSTWISGQDILPSYKRNRCSLRKASSSQYHQSAARSISSSDLGQGRRCSSFSVTFLIRVFVYYDVVTVPRSLGSLVIGILLLSAKLHSSSRVKCALSTISILLATQQTNFERLLGSSSDDVPHIPDSEPGKHRVGRSEATWETTSNVRQTDLCEDNDLYTCTK
jgi:hypothetical protein